MGGVMMVFIFVMVCMLCRCVSVNGVLCVISISGWCFLSVMFVVCVSSVDEMFVVIFVKDFIEYGVMIMFSVWNDLLVMFVVMLFVWW